MVIKDLNNMLWVPEEGMILSFQKNLEGGGSSVG